MHILIIPSFYPERSSPQSGSFFKNQAKVLVNKIDKVGVVYTEQKSLKKIFSNFYDNRFQLSKDKEDGIITYRYHAVNLLNQHAIGTWIWIKLTEKLIKQYIKENGRPDVIHAHNVFHAGRVAMRCSAKYNIPFIITEHASGFLLDEYSSNELTLAKSIYQSSSLNIAVSKGLSRSIEGLCQIDKFEVIPNVVDVKLFHNNREPTITAEFRFIAVGNLLKNKGHHVLIEAFNIFRKKNNDVQLYIYGEGPERSNLLMLIEQFELQSSVFLKGKIMPNELAIEYQKAACLVLPSYHETFGVVLIEAMATGLPVIATKSGGPEDIISENNGLLVEPGNPILLADVMQVMFSNYSIYNQQTIRNYVIDSYSEDIIRSSLIDSYKKVLYSEKK